MRPISIAVLIIFVFTQTAWGQKRAIRPLETHIRQALVIGNANYTHAGVLRNPANDARAISKTLSQLGFKVTMLTDADERQMDQAIRKFGRQLRGNNGVGLFYYAGHGMQIEGENYLLPTDINPSNETDVSYDAVPVGKLLGQMKDAGNGMNVVILDACRNNPFARSFRSSSRGLAQVIAPSGSFISYATSPGSVAADGEGENGLFTEKLLNHITTPGLPLERVFKQVRVDVQRESNNKQIPWDSSSLTGDFFFVSEDDKPIETVLSPVVTQVVDKTNVEKEGQKEKESTKQSGKQIRIVLRGEPAKRELLNNKKCAECDLIGAFLDKATLRGAILIDAILDGAILKEVDLEGATFWGATLRETNINEVNLYGANLDKSILDGANLEGVNLKRATLRGATLRGATLRKTNLDGAILEEANLEGAIFERATLDGANLNKVTLHGATLHGATLHGATLHGATLHGATLSEATLSKAQLCNTTMPDGRISNRDCNQQTFQKEKIEQEQVVLRGEAAKKNLLETKECVGCDLVGINLKFVDLRGVNLQQAYLSKANLEGAVLEGANLKFAWLNHANLKGANLKGANLKGAKRMSRARMSRAVLCNTTFPDGSIRKDDC